MQVDNELINQFLTGTIAVFLLVLIGGVLATLLRSISRKFMFVKTALVLALPPLALSQCVDRGSVNALYLFSTVMILIGFLIDGARYLMCAWKDENSAAPASPPKTEPDVDGTGVVWEKVD